MDEKYGLLQKNAMVVDLGAAPGGWSQVAKNKVGAKGLVLACDLLPMPPPTGVDFIQGDFSTAEIKQKLLAHLAGERADVVLSDTSPNLSGIRVQDQMAAMTLAQHVLQFSELCLRPGGYVAIKLFQGEGLQAWLAQAKTMFQQVKLSKPAASRNGSRELYAIGLNYIERDARQAMHAPQQSQK